MLYFIFYLHLIDISFFLWWEREGASGEIIQALLSVCNLFVFAFNRAIAIKVPEKNLSLFSLLFTLYTFVKYDITMVIKSSPNQNTPCLHLYVSSGLCFQITDGYLFHVQY